MAHLPIEHILISASQHSQRGLCQHVQIYIRIHVHVKCISTHVHMYIHTYIHAYIHAYSIHTYVRMRIPYLISGLLVCSSARASLSSAPEPKGEPKPWTTGLGTFSMYRAERVPPLKTQILRLLNSSTFGQWPNPGPYPAIWS